MLLTAVLFICMSIAARLLRGPPVGLRSRSADVDAGGREDTQSWTRRLTLGFEMRLMVFFEEGLVVMTIVGPDGRMLL
jgi:hypothetical protein